MRSKPELRAAQSRPGRVDPVPPYHLRAEAGREANL
jgi:hypothetical protein